MDLEQAITARLLGAAPVTAIAGARVYWDERPQASALPALVLQVISDPRPQHLQGFNSLRATRVQVDALAATRASARALIEAAIAALVPEAIVGGITFNRGQVDGGGGRPGPGETQLVRRIIADLIIWWSEEE